MWNKNKNPVNNNQEDNHDIRKGCLYDINRDVGFYDDLRRCC